MRRFFVNVAVVAVMLMFPVFMVTLAWGLLLLLEVVPRWVWIIQCLSVVAFSLGIASLIDTSRQHPNPQEPGQ